VNICLHFIKLFHEWHRVWSAAVSCSIVDWCWIRCVFLEQFYTRRAAVGGEGCRVQHTV